jgi:hypothetical protein
MFRKPYLLVAVGIFFLVMHSPAQTTNGLMTGTITDASGAVVAGAQVNITNQGTSELRTTTTDANGYYIVPQLPPRIYDISIKKQGFATVDRPNVQLQVNQSATLDFKLTVSSTAQTIQVTGAPPALNTTSATIGTVIGHSATVDLPLNGREFTQLTLLTPGAAPAEAPQQAAFTIALGAGGISPSVNGQRGQQNNFTMDGTLNTELFTNIWAISPPPDALQEFNVQSHITDAQFAISTGANINIVTRSGTNTFHGSAWEFARNAVLDAQQYPEVKRTPYSQNQYGVYLGGPVMLPHWNGKDNTWFSVYWEGFRSAQTFSDFGNTVTPAMTKGDFSALLGPQVGTDSLGRPEFKNEIYDPATSRPDPNHPGAVLRDPFPGNIIPPNRINPDAPLILQKYYPAPNLNVAANVLPNIQFNAANATASDVTGIRLDHRFGDNDILFGRYNRSDAHLSLPEALPSPGFSNVSVNYAKEYAIGYTHLFGTSTILNLHYGYLDDNLNRLDTPAGAAFDAALNQTLFAPRHNGISMGPQIGMSNGYNGVSQFAQVSGPQTGSDYHVDLSKVVGNHTIGVGGMFYHIYNTSGGWYAYNNFTQNATSQGALASATGMGPASLLLGLPDSYGGWLGNVAATFTVNWYGGYIEDQWQASKRLSITAGLRYDYVSPPSYTKVISALDFSIGQFLITAPYLPLFPRATAPSGLFHRRFNGYEPRFGVAYQASSRTVLQGAFAMLDDHNNTLVQQYASPRLNWPTAASPNITLQNRDLPTTLMNQLPDASTFLNPNKAFSGWGVNSHNEIPYSMEYNAGIEQQLSNTLVLNLDYVGSLSRHLSIEPVANTAPIPGPGSLASRGQPFPQYGGPMPYDTNSGSASYNSFQAELKKSLSSGLFFLASYTWSKSMDIESSLESGSIENFYNMQADWGPSDFNRSQMFVLSGVYALPVGRGKSYLSSPNGFVQAIAGNWNVGSIISLISGAPFDVLAGGDVANVGGGSQRAEEIGNPYSGIGFHQSHNEWINTAAFATPKQYTFGNESRNNLVGPPYKDVDFNAFKDFPLTSRATLQFRGEFFNLFNHTNYGGPVNNVQSPAFGKIFGANPAREIQFALKVLF